MEKEELKELKNVHKQFRKISDSSWSGDDRVVIQTGIYLQLKRIADYLDTISKNSNKR